jgi:hypothetical protein
MPFYKLNVGTISRAHHPVSVPIFLIPSLGNGSDLIPLALEMMKWTDRKIYVYFDPQLVPHSSNHSKEALEAPSLQSKAAEIAQDIERHLSNVFHPAIIVSDKYACGLSYLTAEYLTKQNKDTFLYLIDGATALVAKNYFQDKTKTEEFTKELWEIVLKAAKQYGLDTDEINAYELETFSKIPFETRLNYMTEIVIKSQKCKVDILKLNAFEKLIQAADRQFKLIYHYKDASEFKPISPNIFLHVLLTKKTMSTFGGPFCGWRQYTNQDNIDNANDYERPLENNLAELSQDIINFSRHNVSKDYLLQTQLVHLASNLKKYSQLENSAVKAIITDACATLYDTAKKISPPRSNIDSPVLPKQEEKDPKLKDAFAFFRRYHSVPSIDRVTPEQLENPSSQRKVVVLG